MPELPLTARLRDRIWGGLYLGVCLLELGGRWYWPGGHPLHFFTKPLPLLVLLGYYVGARPPRGAAWQAWLMPAALLASWLGDVLLMFPGEGFFLGGLAAFLGAHLGYAVTFARRRRRIGWRWLALGPGVGLLWYLWPELPPGLRLPVAVYGGVISLMLVLALSRQGQVSGASFGWVAVGAALFVVSDSLLALDRFGAVEIARAGFWVMATYLAAQYLIVGGILRAPAHA